MTAPDARMVESWLRGHGLPQMLPRAVRRAALLRRAAPVLLALLVLDVSLTWSFSVLEGFGTGPAEDESTLVYAAYLATLVAPVIAAGCWVGGVWVARRRGTGRVFAVVVTAAWILGPYLLTRISGERPISRGIPTRLWVLAGLVVLLYLGAGAVLTWAAKRTFSEMASVGVMSSRILPVFLIAVLFLFFNAEIWQVANGLDGGRALVVGSVLLGLALVVVIVTAHDEMRALLDERDPRVDPAEHRRLVAGTPLADYPVPESRPDLHLGERLNLIVVTIAAQVIQVVMFGAVMAVFFVAFGQLAVTDGVAKAWTAADPVPIVVEGVSLPVSTVLGKVALLLGCFSGLSFAASSSTNALYRKAFLDPLLVQSLTNLAVRDAYRRLIDGTDRADVAQGAMVGQVPVAAAPVERLRRTMRRATAPTTPTTPSSPKQGVEPGAGSARQASTKATDQRR